MQMRGINTENLSVCSISGEAKRIIASCLGRRSYLWRTATVSGLYVNHTLIPATLVNQYTEICFARNVKIVSGFIGLRAQTGIKT
jgi:hypothetical protein